MDESRHWPKASEQEQVLARPLNTRPKFVASRTLKAPLEWSGALLLGDDALGALDRLKREGDGTLLAIGSPGLVQSMLERELVDELRLMIDPVVLGGGKRFFHDDGRLHRFQLGACTQTTSGALLCTYVRGTE